MPDLRKRIAYSWNARPANPDARRNFREHLNHLAAAATAFCRSEREWSSLDEAADLGLLPISLREHLTVIGFLAATVLDAQAAQRKYGVPASVLIAIGLAVSGWDASALPGGNGWFLKEAHYLARSGKFQPALGTAADVKSYLAALRWLGYFSNRHKGSFDADDVLSPIDDYDLRDCDVAGLLPLGEYSGTRYEATRDEGGTLELRPANQQVLRVGPDAKGRPHLRLA